MDRGECIMCLLFFVNLGFSFYKMKLFGLVHMYYVCVIRSLTDRDIYY